MPRSSWRAAKWPGGEEQQAAGTGLGLSIVKRIADAHGASIALDAPAEGTGLVVTVRFPAS